MWRIDNFLMTLQRHFLTLFYKFIYFFMFRKYKSCRSFCLHCKDFDACMESVKQSYRMSHTRDYFKK